MTLGELRNITSTVVHSRPQHYADPALAAEVAAHVTKYILGIPGRFGPPQTADQMADVVNEREVVIDVLEQVLNEMEAETRP